jgi:hypothetical protein
MKPSMLELQISYAKAASVAMMSWVGLAMMATTACMMPWFGMFGREGGRSAG